MTVRFYPGRLAELASEDQLLPGFPHFICKDNFRAPLV